MECKGYMMTFLPSKEVVAGRQRVRKCGKGTGDHLNSRACDFNAMASLRYWDIVRNSCTLVFKSFSNTPMLGCFYQHW